MTRKKYIKVLMSLGVQRNEAQRMAEYQRLQRGSYTDIRADGLPSLHLFGIRCALIISVLKEQILRYLDNREIEYRHEENGGNYDS